MSDQFEAVGDVADWLRNEPGKPGQAAVFGVYPPKKGKRWEVLWTGKFPELEPALYWRLRVLCTPAGHLTVCCRGR